DKALMRVLSRAEYDQFESYSTPAGSELLRVSVGMEPTDAEFAAMFGIKWENWTNTGGVYGRYRTIRVPPEEITMANQRMESEMREALGAERYADYQLATTELGQQMRDLAAR